MTEKLYSSGGEVGASWVGWRWKGWLWGLVVADGLSVVGNGLGIASGQGGG